MAGWEEWFQGQASDVLGKWSSKEFAPDQTVQGSMTLGRLGEGGYYMEGQPGVAKTQAGMSDTTKLMIGGGLLVVVLLLVLKD